MSYFYQIESGEYFNKVFGDNPPSGAEVIPYTFGWSNKFAPRPFGFKVRAEAYSSFASSNISNPITHIPSNQRSLANSNSLFTFLQHPVPPGRDFNYASYGPVNAVYEIELSGVQSTAGGCRSCSSMNGKYYVYQIPGQNLFNSPSDIFNPRSNGLIGNLKDGVIHWHGKICDLSKPINLCNFNLVHMSLTNEHYKVNQSSYPFLTSENQYVETQTSGNIVLYVDFVRAQSTVYVTGVVSFVEQNKWRFIKDYGDMASLDPNNIMRKPNMFTEIILLPSSTPSYGFQAPTFGVDSLLGFSGSGDITYDDFECDISNAVVIVRPFKSGLYDIRQSMSSFYDIHSFPNLLGYTQQMYTDNIFLPEQNNVSLHNGADFYNYFCNNYLNNNTGNQYLTGTTDNRFYIFKPRSFQLSFDSVSEISGSNRVNCISCETFYKKQKNVMSYHPSNENVFKWISTAVNENYWDASYYNICNDGCVSLSSKNDFNQGPCNNFIQLELQHTHFATPSSIVDANLYFGALYYSGLFFNSDRTAAPFITNYSYKKLRKRICDSTTSNKCASGDFSFSAFGVFGNALSGQIECFNAATWSSGWVLENNTLRTPILPSYLDVNHYCDFSSGNVRLEPPATPKLPCAAPPCTICGEDRVPQSISISIVANDPSGYSIDKTYIVPASQINFAFAGRDNIYADTGHTISQGTCAWVLGAYNLSVGGECNGGIFSFLPPDCTNPIDNSGDGASLRLELLTRSNNQHVFRFTGFIEGPAVTGQGGFITYPYGAWSFSAIGYATATGGSMDIGIDCGSPIVINTSGSIQAGIYNTLRAATITIEFEDIYDLNDYV